MTSSATTTFDEIINQPLAIQGGPKAVPQDEPDLFKWPIVTDEDEQAVLDVLRNGNMSAGNISREFEAEWASYNGVKHALSYPNGTMALTAAMYSAGLRRGDEMICQSITFWASALQAFSIGATIVYADIDPQTLCIDPKDIERHITPRTKAILVVHYCGYPADMDAITKIAEKYNLKIIEDVSHAHGAMYKGRMVGSFGDVAGMSMMSGKSFAIGEAGMLVTNNREIYEQAISFSHYERSDSDIKNPKIRQAVGVGRSLPLGGVKGRLNQTCAAMGRIQLKYYPKRIEQIENAMTRFWDLLEGTPGIRPHRPPKDSGLTKGGWYNALGHYLPEELENLPHKKFVDAVAAEGVGSAIHGTNFPMHDHPVLNQTDIYGDGKPTRIAFSDRDLRQTAESLPISAGILERAFQVPWFKHDRPESIERYAAAIRKVAIQADKLR